MQLKTATLGESKASKEVSNLVLKIILAIMGVGGMVLGVTFVASGAVYADGGGWTGSGTAVTPSGTPGGSYGGYSCSGDNAYYILGCTGFSWVYYRYVGGSAGRGRSITFRPYNNNSNGGYVSGACARTDGGFWHFGRNARGFPYGGYASFNYVYGYSDATSVYRAGQGKWGHMETYTYGTYINYSNYYDWSHTPSGAAYYAPSNLGQTLYRKIDGTYVKMYEATRVGNVRTVLANYKSAYKFSNGTNYNGSSLPTNVYAFCYWGDMENTDVTLTAKAITTAGVSLSEVSGLADKQNTVENGKLATVTRGTAAGYTFLGWRERLTGAYVTSTNSGDDVYVSGSENPEESLNVRALTANKTVYAVYERNAFQGRARVFEGGNTSGTNAKSTGWTAEDGERAIEVGCGDEGCRATFDFYLRTRAGTGTTAFGIYRSKNGGSNVKQTTVSPESPVAPETSGTVLKLDGKTSYTETLYPGETVCYSLVFRPYGVNANTARATLKVCAEAKASTFQGETAAGTTSTGWQSTDTAKKHVISNCAATGCNVTFKHSLRRTVGEGSTNYVISRESNYWVSKKSLGVAPNANLKSGVERFTAVENGTGVAEYTEQLKLVPGQVVCEAMTFKVGNNIVDLSGVATTRVCASALGNAQPSPGATGADALLNIEVKNENVASYNTYQKNVYAKPGDKLTFRATYNPVLQYTYYLVPQATRITCKNGMTEIYKNGSGLSLGILFNSYRAICDSGLGTWKNGFSVESSGFTMTTIDYDGYTVGDTTRREETNSHTVASAEVGRKLTENARTNLNDKTKTTPSQVTFTDGTKGNTGNVVTTDQVSNAAALIPYNFINTTEITAVDRTLFYAGEEAKVSYRVDVNEKRNNVTDGTYATIVRGAKWKLEVCMDGQGDCHETTEGTGNITGRTKTVNTTIAIPDVRAGSEICLRSGVYPANSGADTNWEDAKGSNTWQYSEWRCFKVAKRPSLQVWGGNVYSGGKIQTGVSIKNNLTGVTEYNVGTKNANNYVFGSWGELGVISVGAVTGFASGAGTGYDLGSLEAVNNTRFSLRSTLTFANYPNGATMVSGLGSNNGTIKNAIQGHKSRMMENLINTENERVSVFLDEAEFLNGNNLIKVFYRKGDIRITNNIIYGGGSYSKFSEMPKNVVYAEGGSIIISCDVGRIDAVLVADREVRTCDSDDVDAEANSRPLRINGAIIADRLVANRTYGAATGVNSIVPAEVVNFDPTLYLWGNYREETEEVRDFMTTYMHEVAPRL